MVATRKQARSAGNTTVVDQTHGLSTNRRFKSRSDRRKHGKHRRHVKVAAPQSSLQNKGIKDDPIDLTRESAKRVIDLTKGSSDETEYKNSSKATEQTTEPDSDAIHIEAEQSGQKTMAVSEPGEEGRQSFSSEQVTIDNGSEPQTSEIKSEALQAPIGTVTTVLPAFVQTAAPEPGTTGNEKSQPSPAIVPHPEQSSIGGADFSDNRADSRQEAVQTQQKSIKEVKRQIFETYKSAVSKLVEALEKAEKSVGEAKRRHLIAKREWQEAVADEKEIKATLQSYQISKTKLEKDLTKRGPTTATGRARKFPRQTSTREPTYKGHIGTNYTNISNSEQHPIIASDGLQIPHAGDHQCIAGGTILSDTRSDTLYTAILDRTTPSPRRENPTTTEEQDQVVDSSGHGQPLHRNEFGITRQDMRQNELYELKIRQHVEDHGKCDCSKKEPSQRSCARDCSNAATLIICDVETCSLDESLCRNRWAEVWTHKQDGISPYLRKVEDSRCGAGVIWTGSQIQSGGVKRLAEYTGEYISSAEHSRRKERTEHITEGHFAFELKVPADWDRIYLDSTYVTSLARLINHSCDPNAEAVQYWARDGIRLMIESSKTISTGDPITINYGSAPTEFRVTIGGTVKSQPVCHCGCKGKCKWPLSQAVHELEVWLETMARTWPKTPLPEYIELCLRGARDSIQVHSENYETAEPGTILQKACREVVMRLKKSLRIDVDEPRVS
ncbi:histone-lysine n-methyltransferase ASHH3-like isoform X1 [Fusarium heterosporum]|uniref:Histone-lysine n-methyltransferase ASHH3-like isoform X1 n=1 Tax=Fusarium heterosporum TaxID=42747 RepID=A0A8H5TTL5_FUSHE|nr:histone-lysine n-methyltransferase ASHH3-like isoform X1 [Fusarium heterosporum]